VVSGRATPGPARLSRGLRAVHALALAWLVVAMAAGALHAWRRDGHLPRLGLNPTRFFRALEERGERAELEREWRALAAIDPGSRARAYSNLAALLAQQGRSEEAKAEIARALDHAPGDASLHTNLALLLASEQRVEAALAALATALALRPDYAPALELRAELLRAVGAPPAAAPAATDARNDQVSRAQRSHE
jgi:tetratricopeptide (TPR) repeat protein